MEILKWIITHWTWVALLWLVIGIGVAHLVIRTQEEPIRVYPDGYVKDFADSGFMYKWLIPLGNKKVLMIAPFYVLVALLMVIVWPATLLLLLLLTYVARGK